MDLTNTMDNNIIFTRYLYLKEEVRYALVTSILLRERDKALFWGFELFHSGFEDEVFDLLWKMYYDFYATLNPTLEKYMARKYFDPAIKRDLALASIIINMSSKPCTTDVFMMRLNPKREPDYNIKWLEMRDYTKLANYIMHVDLSRRTNIINNVLEHFGETKWKKMRNTFVTKSVDMRLVFLSHIMQICTLSTRKMIPRINRLNLSVSPVTVEPFMPITSDRVRPDKLLKEVCKYSINCSQMLGAFELARHACEIDMDTCYRKDWLFHGSFSPYWSDNISKHGGVVDVENRKIIFEEVTKEEMFIDACWLDPDEQSLETQRKSTVCIDKIDNGVLAFYKAFSTFNITNMCESELRALRQMKY